MKDSNYFDSNSAGTTGLFESMTEKQEAQHETTMSDEMKHRIDAGGAAGIFAGDIGVTESDVNSIKMINKDAVRMAHTQSYNKDGTIHYDGVLGTFDYNPNEFMLKSAPCKDLDGTDTEVVVLKYIGNETDGSKIHIPEGLENGYMTFMGSDITSTPKLPKSLRHGDAMFQNCQNLKDASAELPKGMESASFMYACCDNMTEGPKKIPGSIDYANFMFVECKNLLNTPKIENGIKSGEFMFADCKNLTENPKPPRSMTDKAHITYGCDSLDAQADMKRMNDIEKQRAKLEQRLSRPTFRQKMGSAFSAVMQTHALHQMGYGFMSAPIMAHMMRKNGMFNKSMAGGWSAMAQSAKHGRGFMAAMAVASASNAGVRERKQAEKKDATMAAFDKAYDSGSFVISKKAASDVKNDLKHRKFQHVVDFMNEGPEARRALQESYGGEAMCMNKMLDRVAGKDGTLNMATQKAAKDWYDKRLSNAAMYYAEGVEQIRNCEFKTMQDRDKAMQGLKEITKMKLNPLLKSMEESQEKYHLFNNGDLNKYDKLSKYIPGFETESKAFSRRMSPNEDHLKNAKSDFQSQTAAHYVSGAERFYDRRSSDLDNESTKRSNRSRMKAVFDAMDDGCDDCNYGMDK